MDIDGREYILMCDVDYWKDETVYGRERDVEVGLSELHGTVASWVDRWHRERRGGDGEM